MRKLLVALFFISLVTTVAVSQGIEFFHGTWEEALLKAKTEDKIIFVDAFTTWCGPCKHMAANTFTAPEVGEYYNQNFINMKIDMEKEMGLNFKRKFPVTAYPTLFFIDYDEEVVLKSVGGKNVADFLKLGESVYDKYDKSKKFEAAYAAGDRSHTLVINYVSALNKAGKPSVKIANEYLESQTDLTTPENLKFILEAASQVDCKCFDLLEKYKAEIIKLTSQEAVEKKVMEASANTVKRAIEFESYELVELAADAMKRHVPAEADYFKSKSELQYALALHDMSRIEELVNNHVKKFVKNDQAGLHQLALDLDKYGSDDAACRQLSISLAEKAAKDFDPKYVVTLAQLKYKSGASQDALQIIDEALKKLGDEEGNKDVQLLKALRAKIQNS